MYYQMQTWLRREISRSFRLQEVKERTYHVIQHREKECYD